ncbi:TPA: hypothetical protein KNH77_000003 [Clostridioides difficile]|uniref:hypothetical protein n=1 Tax=Clostridioides difficile TaxID=1496 RepID=UPI00038CB507|nr:hypothetical protein [Clostridioides difficile]CEK40238.1 protein of unknown function [Clostridium phage phiCD24-1]EGT3757419.1 hypothetical protein [Clostridioides difficile]EGT3783125.1 hypothetical protein [Clostridioides difficile]EGT4160660.1 hypothetical protein [Clostridioides difficile]EGT4634681.1 hypothetical protein [Clostridioides difficile]
MLNEEARKKILNLPVDTNKRFEDIENLKEVLNLSYITDNGECTIENSKKGYLTNVNIQGKTLVNLSNPNNIIVTEGLRYLNPFKYIEKEKQYTFINLSDKEIYYFHDNIIKFQMNPNSKTLYTIDIDITDTNCLCIAHSVKGWGETDVDKQEFTKSVIILEGDYTTKDISYFEGLQSVGQGNKIEILTTEINTPNLIKSDYIYTQGKYNSLSGEYLDTDDKYYACEEFIEIKGNTEYVFYGLNANRQYYDSNKNFIQGISSPEKYFQLTGNSSWRYWVEKTPSNAHFIKVTLHVDNLINGKAMLFEGNKFDKKIIPYTLRSLPDGTKDEIVYKNNKYYLIKRCEEVILDGDNFNPRTLEDQNNNIVLYVRTDPVPDAKPLEGALGRANTIYCDKFKSVDTTWGNEITTEGIIIDQNRTISFRILKSKLETQDIEGAKKWMRLNPIKVVYPLEIPEEIELTSLDLQQYNSQTRFICETSIIPSINFESTQNLGSHIEVIRNNIKSINNIHSKSVIIDLSNKLLNGWKKTVSDNDGFIISKNGNQVSFHMRITGGIITDSTALLKLPDGFTPKTFYVFPIFTTQNNQLVQGFMYFNFANGYIQITQLGSNKDIYSYGTYFIE